MAYKYTPEQIKQAYSKMPRDLRDVYFAEETGENLQKISRNNSLTVQQAGDLADETGLVMLGLTPTKEYIANITARLEISRERAQKIAHDINDQIFSRVREALKEVHGLKPRSAEPERTPTFDSRSRDREDSKLSPIINPQQIIAESKTSLEDLANEAGGLAIPRSQDASQVAEALEADPDLYKIKKPIAENQDKPTPVEAPAGKDIFSEKMNEEGFRSAPETVEKTPAPFFDSAPAKTLPETAVEVKTEGKKDWKNPTYGQQKDPYRADPTAIE